MLSVTKAYNLARANGFSYLITKPHMNTKLAKSMETAYYNCGITLAQARMSGYNMCPGSTQGCRASCLGGWGRAEYLPMASSGRINRTILFHNNPELFWNILETEMHAIDRYATKYGLKVAFRPDILSDQNWHTKFPQMFSEFPRWQFYGYTKVRSKVSAYLKGNLPPNYYLTYSWSERMTIEDVKAYKKDGINISVPFYNKETLKPIIPKQWYRMIVENGDKTDLRFLDPPNRIIGLGVKLPKKRENAIRVIQQSNGFFVGI